jgi:hypothetical protein
VERTSGNSTLTIVSKEIDRGNLSETFDNVLQRDNQQVKEFLVLNTGLFSGRLLQPTHSQQENKGEKRGKKREITMVGAGNFVSTIFRRSGPPAHRLRVRVPNRLDAKL